MRELSLDFLRRLVNTPSPSGQETRGQRVWLDYVKQFAKETFSDACGNCVATLNKGGSPRLMLAAHADEMSPDVQRQHIDSRLGLASRQHHGDGFGAIPFGCCAIASAGILAWPGLEDYLTTGHTTLHWSRAIVAACSGGSTTAM